MVFTIKGITYDLCSDSAIEFAQMAEKLERVRKSLKELESIPYESKEFSNLYHDLYRVLSDTLDRIFYDDTFKCFYKECHSLYMTLNAIEHEGYYKANIKDFLEYASHKNEPDFDWSFYSDWHKDIYGYRPRY